ncbi:hypothetical protein ABZ871_10785 [Streptomyces populi]
MPSGGVSPVQAAPPSTSAPPSEASGLMPATPAGRSFAFAAVPSTTVPPMQPPSQEIGAKATPRGPSRR